MGSNIKRIEKIRDQVTEVRPSWTYNSARGDINHCQLEMIESCRNVLEDVLTELKLLNRPKKVGKKK